MDSFDGFFYTADPCGATVTTAFTPSPDSHERHVEDVLAIYAAGIGCCLHRANGESFSNHLPWLSGCVPRRESDSGVCQACRDSRGRYPIEAGEGRDSAGTEKRRLVCLGCPDLRRGRKSLGWVGLEPTTNALKGRYYQSVKLLL
jgi:hypothetical protein